MQGIRQKQKTKTFNGKLDICCKVKRFNQRDNYFMLNALV